MFNGMSTGGVSGIYSINSTTGGGRFVSETHDLLELLLFLEYLEVTIMELGIVMKY